ncbi:MAG: hypothetical protein IKM92_03070 [Bacteroidaceae bacterium]|nr:hypothetical protein [Bacteroidaceae bacterium]
MIQIKAKQQNVSFEKNVEKLAFVLSAHLYNTLDADKVIDEAAKRSGISAGVIKAAWVLDRGSVALYIISPILLLRTS